MNSVSRGALRTAAAGEALSVPVMLALALPALPMSALTIPLVSFLPEFYASSLGLQLGMVGMAFMIVRLFDLGIDPLLGALMDRTRSRWGRYKPWLVAGVPVVTLGTYFLMFAKPGVGPAYLVTWLLVTYIGFSIVVLSQLALISAQTTGYHERSHAFGWWQAAYTAGILIVISMPMMMGAGTSNDRAVVMHGMGLVVLAATPLTVAFTCWRVPDASTRAAGASVGWRDYLRLFKRRSTRLLLLTVLLIGLATGTTAAVAVIFFLAVKHLTIADFSLQMLVLFSVAVFTAPMWVRVARRLGKHRAYALGASCNILFFAGMALAPPGQALWVVLLGAVSGFAYGAANQMPRAMLADINDEELLEHGQDRTGMLYALLTGIDKIGFALAVGISFQVLAACGYVPSLGPHNPPNAIRGVLWMNCGVTTLLTLAGSLLILRYPLTQQRHARIREELERRAGRAFA